MKLPGLPFPIEEEDEEQPNYGSNLPQPQAIQVNQYKDFRLLWAEVEASLLGGQLDFDPITKKYSLSTPKDAKPYMTRQGISDCIAFLKLNVNVATGTSIMNEERVMRICKKTAQSLLIMLQNNRERFEIEPGKLLLICQMLMNVFEANMRTSIDGKGLEWFLQHERIIETRNITPPQPGLLRRLI